jgi:hypothetical protein
MHGEDENLAALKTPVLLLLHDGGSTVGLGGRRRPFGRLAIRIRQFNWVLDMILQT